MVLQREPAALGDAGQRLRFERTLACGRAGDPIEFNEFTAKETRQMEAADSSAQALAACRDAADRRIDNKGTLEEFRTSIVQFLKKESSPISCRAPTGTSTS